MFKILIFTPDRKTKVAEITNTSFFALERKIPYDRVIFEIYDNDKLIMSEYFNKLFVSDSVPHIYADIASIISDMAKRFSNFDDVVLGLKRPDNGL